MEQEPPSLGALGPFFLELRLGLIDLGAEEMDHVSWALSVEDGCTSDDHIRTGLGALVNCLGAYTAIDLDVKVRETVAQLAHLGHALPNELLPARAGPYSHHKNHVECVREFVRDFARRRAGVDRDCGTHAGRFDLTDNV